MREFYRHHASTTTPETVVLWPPTVGIDGGVAFPFCIPRFYWMFRLVRSIFFPFCPAFFLSFFFVFGWSVNNLPNQIRLFVADVRCVYAQRVYVCVCLCACTALLRA